MNKLKMAVLAIIAVSGLNMFAKSDADMLNGSMGEQVVALARLAADYDSYTCALASLGINDKNFNLEAAYKAIRAGKQAVSSFFKANRIPQGKGSLGLQVSQALGL